MTFTSLAQDRPAARPSANRIVFESGEAQKILLELFTSEGCSSCPPADAWISRLKTSGDLWKKVVPVVWHVDYWDRLGWRDRFAKREFTARQQQYAAEWKSDSVYTPAFVANGREWKTWSGADGVASSSAGAAGNLRVVLNDNQKISASFTPSSPINEPLQFQIALLGVDLESNVARGENSGRKLHHDFVALTTAKTNLHRTGASYTAELILPNEQLPAKPAALAGWVVSAQGKPPMQATGGWMKSRE